MFILHKKSSYHVWVCSYPLNNGFHLFIKCNEVGFFEHLMLDYFERFDFLKNGGLIFYSLIICFLEVGCGRINLIRCGRINLMFLKG
jgi:hypothetical protein